MHRQYKDRLNHQEVRAVKAYRIDKMEKLMDPLEQEYTREQDTSYMQVPPRSPRNLFKN